MTAMTCPASAQTIDQFKDNFVRVFGEQCLSTQRASAENASLPDETIVKYCGCVTRHAPEVVTYEDLQVIEKTGQRGRGLQNKLNALGKTCAEWMRGEVRDDGPIVPKGAK